MTPSSNKSITSFILASGSPRRKNLLPHLGVPFTVKPSTVDETIPYNQSPPKIAETLALRKARDVAARHASAIVLGADTIVVHQGDILGKPDNPAHARAILTKLSGTIHQVLTGIALIKTDENGKVLDEKTFTESTTVTFGKPKNSDIDNYVAGGSPMDKAGAYGIQDAWGAIFVKRIEGDYYNIVGLPLHSLYHQLKTFAPDIFID